MNAIAAIVFVCTIHTIPEHDEIFTGTWEQAMPVYQQMLIDNPFPQFEIYCYKGNDYGN